MKHPITFIFRDTIEHYTELDEIIISGEFSDLSALLRSALDDWLKLRAYRNEIKRPEFLADIESLRRNNSLFDWMQTLTQNEKDALMFALKADNVKRYSQEVILK